MALRAEWLSRTAVLVVALVIGGGAPLAAEAAAPSPHVTVSASSASPSSAPAVEPLEEYLWS